MALSDLVGPAGVLERVRSVGGTIVRPRWVAWSSCSHLCPVVREAGGTEVGDDTWAPLGSGYGRVKGVLAWASYWATFVGQLGGPQRVHRVKGEHELGRTG